MKNWIILTVISVMIAFMAIGSPESVKDIDAKAVPLSASSGNAEVYPKPVPISDSRYAYLDNREDADSFSSEDSKNITAASSSDLSQYGGTLRWLHPSVPGTNIGYPAISDENSAFSMQLSEQFLLKQMADGSLAPNLAVSYDVVYGPNNPSITFHLQKGVKFHDGTDFNAQAAKWNLDQVKNCGLYNRSSGYWESVDVIDDYTIKVNLTQWLNTIPGDFADFGAYMVSPTAYQKNGLDWIRLNMVGTGPFMQKEFKRDVSLTTVRNPNYWEPGLPYLDGVTLLYVLDEMTRLALFKSGDGEIMDIVGDGRIANELQAEGFNIIKQQGGAVILVPDSINPDSPWSNLKVRQAVEHAIDKEAIVKAFGYGYW